MPNLSTARGTMEKIPPSDDELQMRIHSLHKKLLQKHGRNYHIDTSKNADTVSILRRVVETRCGSRGKEKLTSSESIRGQIESWVLPTVCGASFGRCVNWKEW